MQTQPYFMPMPVIGKEKISSVDSQLLMGLFSLSMKKKSRTFLIFTAICWERALIGK